MLSQGLLPTTAEINAPHAGHTAAAPTEPTGYLECPAWCVAGHRPETDGTVLRIRAHRRELRYVDLQGYPDAYTLVWVTARDSWIPGTSAGWKRDRPSVMIGPAHGEAIHIWNVPTLRPILKAGPLLMPGLLELIIEAAQFCEIKIPQEYAR